MQDTRNIAARYSESCRKDFWQEVFRAELDYLLRQLGDRQNILSIGCGSAVLEEGLCRHGYHVTGLDISREALKCTSGKIRTVMARAEDMPFPDSSFDAVVLVASLQFVDNVQKVVERSVSVLRPEGMILAMLLNPESAFFKEKLRQPDSYVRRIKHPDLGPIENALSENFHVEAEYFLGVECGMVARSRDPGRSLLYIIRGIKTPAMNKEKGCRP